MQAALAVHYPASPTIDLQSPNGPMTHTKTRTDKPTPTRLSAGLWHMQLAQKTKGGAVPWAPFKLQNHRARYMTCDSFRMTSS